jgi:hypothetical protein
MAGWHILSITGRRQTYRRCIGVGVDLCKSVVTEVWTCSERGFQGEMTEGRIDSPLADKSYGFV